MKWKYIATVFLLLAVHCITEAQEIKHNESESHPVVKGSNRLILGLGHTHVSEGKVNGKTRWLAMPSWSLNYDYWLSEKMAIGLQNDLILETFIIENHEQELIERKYPFAVIPVVLFKPGEHLTLIGGIGAEFSKGHTLTMTRLPSPKSLHKEPSV